MSAGTFAHKLLALFGVFAALLLILVLAYSGYVGLLVEEAVRSAASSTIAFYQTNATILDSAARWVGAVATCVFGIIAFVNAWHYAEVNLPKRLAEMIEREIGNHIELRSEFVTVNVSPSFEELLRPLPTPSGIQWLLNRLNLFSPRTLADKLSRDPDVLATSIGTLNKRIEELKLLQASAYIARGVEWARDRTPEDEKDKSGGEVLLCFRAATQSKPDDLDAIELTAKQMSLLGAKASEVDELLKRMCEQAHQQAKPITQARALRFIAERLKNEGTTSSLREARQRIRAGIDLLEGNLKLDQAARDEELARCYELMGLVQTRREVFPTANTSLDRAVALYLTIPEPERSQGHERVKSVRDELELAERGAKAQPD